MKEFFARLNPTERRFVVGVAVVFFLVVNFVWIWPHFSDWGKTQARMAAAQKKMELFNKGIAKTPEIDREITKYQSTGVTVPPEDQAVQFVRMIYNEASRSGVIIQSLGGPRQNTDTNNPFFIEQNQTVSVQSDEKQLVNFLYNLGAGSNSLIRVRSLSVQPDPPRQQLSSRITLVASYEKKAPAARTTAPAAATATPKTTTAKPTPTTALPAPAQKPPVTAPGNRSLPPMPVTPKNLTPNKP
jgi:hypothetical protein